MAPSLGVNCMMLKDENGEHVIAPIHMWFGLSRASYFVMPRMALEHMPVEWQRRFISLMNEAEDHGVTTPNDYVVSIKVNGRFAADEWADYRRGAPPIVWQPGAWPDASMLDASASKAA